VNRAKSSRNWILRIQDILQSIDKIDHYLEKITLTEFRKNGLIIDAVVRNFEIIGEASKHIPNTIQSLYPDIPWKEMNGMRNILIHEYFDMEADIVWHTAKKQLPKLKKQLRNIPIV
jgi:uncharacterized protein with HEPN domain